jgi:hypothetical protein
MPNDRGLLKEYSPDADGTAMKLFRRGAASSKREDRAYEIAVNDRMRNVLSRETNHDDPESVETRLRNMIYGTNKQ